MLSSRLSYCSSDTSRLGQNVSQALVRWCQSREGMTASIFSKRNTTGVDSHPIIFNTTRLWLTRTPCPVEQELTILATRAISPGYWCVVRASPAVNVHRNPVNRMKNGSSRLGYTDNSWWATGQANISISSRDACQSVQSVHYQRNQSFTCRYMQ